jgi:hypothetical protein
MYTIPENMPERPVVAVESISAENMMVVTGAVKPAPVSVYPTNATNTKITYISDNAAVAYVNAAGDVIAVAPGTANITASVVGEGGSTAVTTFTVTVLQGGTTLNAFLAGDLATNASQFWFTLPDADPSNVDYMNAVEAELFYYSAEYCADTGYVYAYGFDPMDWSSSWYFVTMDPANNWKVVEFKEMAQNFPFVYDLTYNYVEGVMYAVADVSDTSSDLYMVDMATGNLLPVMELVYEDGTEMQVLGLAAAPDGKLYGIANSTTEIVFNWETWMEEEVVADAMLYQFDTANGEIIPVGPTGFKHNSLGSMAFDMDTGNLYWASLYNGPAGYVSNLCLVDEETGAAISLGAPCASGAQLTGLYIIADSYPECNAQLSVTVEDKVVAYQGDVFTPVHVVTGAAASVTWTSNNTDIITVQADGSLLAVGSGFTTVTLTVTGEDGTVVTATVGISVVAQDSYFLAYNSKTNTWEKIDRRNPLNVTSVEGSTTEAALLASATANGVIYAYDEMGNFYSINPETLAPTVLGAVDLSLFYRFRDMAWDDANGRLLALVTEAYDDWSMEGVSGIYQVDLATGLLTKLVEVENGGAVEAITVGMDGTVYVLDESYYPTQDVICAVDMFTGAKTILNSLNRVGVYTSSRYSNAMITDPVTGMLYLMTTSNGNYYMLTSFNPATNLIVSYGTLGETDTVYDEWGWTETVGNTYNTMITLDTHEHLFSGEPVEIEDDCDSYKAVKQTCLLCGEITTVISGHQYEFVSTVAPDCTNGGYDHYECKCGLTEKRNPTAALGHTPGAEADCLNDQICTVCNEVLVYAYGHDMVQNDPTLVCPGTYDATCSVCGEAGTVKKSGYHTVYVCSGSGYLYKGTCDLCSATLSYSAYARKVVQGHVNPNPENMTDCTAGYTCERCGQNVVEYAQHCYDRVLADADCVNPATRTYSCVRCEAEKVYEVGEANGHSFAGQGELLKAPTTTEAGLLKIFCEHCGHPSETEIPALNALEYTYEVLQAPTESEDGLVRYTWKQTLYGVHSFDVVVPFGAAQFVIDSAVAPVGSIVRLEVVLKNNPGIAGVLANVVYDESVMTLVDVENGTLLDSAEFGEYAFILDNSANAVEDGVICVLVFQIAEDAPLASYSVTLNLENVMNENEQPIEAYALEGEVTFINSAFGDANGDGKINLADVLRLRKYLVNRDPETHESDVEIWDGADVNYDGTVSLLDVLRLRKHLANRNPITGESSVVLGPEA